MNKYIFADSGIVVGIVVGSEENGVTFTGPVGSIKYVQPVGTEVDVGWHVSGTIQNPIFTAP